jgi:single-stranded-DNA-specific exonuclease
VTSDAPWTIRSPNPIHVSSLAEGLSLRRATAACLVNRGITSLEAARPFLEPRLDSLTPPIDIPEMNRAAERVAAAVYAQERVGVFGDYDVDGITSAAVMTLFLKALRVDVVPQIADRFSGYGMGVGVMEAFRSRGCSLVVAVDLGTSDHEAARAAREAGMDLVVIDHHSVVGDHPDVYAFVNPQRRDCAFEDKGLAAVGLSFYFIATVRTVLCGQGYVTKDDLDIRGLLDLVALGTVADVMPLRGNNRILVSHGLRKISDNPRIGLRKLMRVSRIRATQIRSDHIAYQLAPRLNAAGRVGKASEAFNLLVSSDSANAETLAIHLDQLSIERRRLENEVLEDARRKLIAKKEKMGLPITFVSGDGWHRGVLGIVASRLVEETGRPAFVVGIDGDEGIGSVRGRGHFNVYESLAAATDHLRRFGGHRDAAGFTVERDQLDHLRAALIAFAEAHGIDAADEPLQCDARLLASEIDAELALELSRIGPFGPENPEPIFDIDGLFVLDQRVISGDHLKLELKTPTGRVSAFGPRMAAVAGNLPHLIRTAAHISPDEWRGNGEPELRLVVPPIPGN